MPTRGTTWTKTKVAENSLRLSVRPHRPGRNPARDRSLAPAAGMPIPIMISIGIEFGLQIVLDSDCHRGQISLSGNFARWRRRRRAFGNRRHDHSGTDGPRQSKTRWQAIVLDGIGIGAACLCIVPIVMFSGAQQPGSQLAKVSSFKGEPARYSW